MSSHGSYRMWADGCRCTTCRQAEQASNGTLAPSDPRHGTWSGFADFACRCEPCRTVAKERRP